MWHHFGALSAPFEPGPGPISSPARSVRNHALTIIALLVCGACGFSDRDGARLGTVVFDTLESGIVVARNSPPPDRYEAPRWMIEEELRIGTLDGAGPDLFGEIRGIEADDEGRIYVLESQAQEIRVFGPDGAHLFTFGGKGEGPGEFTGAHGLARAPDGRIWVPDHRNGRYTVFEADGSLAATHRTIFWSYGYIWCCGFGRDGYLYDNAGFDPDDSERRTLLRRFDGLGEVVDEFPYPEPPPGYQVDFYRFESPDGTSGGTMAIPFSSAHRVSFDPRGGFLTSMTDRYRIERLDFRGDTLQVTEARLEAILVSAEEREAMARSVSEFAEQFGAKPDLSKIPSVKPLLISNFVDDAGRLWVRTSAPAKGDTRFDLFDEDGRFLGAAVATFPVHNWLTPRIRGDYLYTVVDGEFEEPYLVRALIRRLD